MPLRFKKKRLRSFFSKKKKSIMIIGKRPELKTKYSTSLDKKKKKKTSTCR